MIGQAAGAIRKVIRLHDPFTIANENSEQAEAATLDDTDLEEDERPATGLFVLPLLAWFVLVGIAAVAEHGAGLLDPAFWLSTGGLGLLIQAGLPAIVVLALRRVSEHLRGIERHNAEMRASLARLADPEPASSGKIVSIRHAMRKELASLNEHLDRSLNKTSEIEAVIKREVGTLEVSFAENERRMLGLVQELARQRETVIITTEQVKDVVKSSREALNGELANLASQVLEAGNYARGIVHEVGFELKAELEAQSSDVAEALRRMVDEKIVPINDMLGAQVRSIDALLSDGGGGLVTTFETHGRALVDNLNAAWTRIDTDLANQSQQAGDIATRLTAIVDQSLDGNVNHLESRIRSASLEILDVLNSGADRASQKIVEVATGSTAAFDERLDALHGRVEAQMQRFGQLMDGAAEGFVPALERCNDKLERAIVLEGAFEQTTARLSTVLTEQAGEFVDVLSRNVSSFRVQLTDKAGEVSDGLVGKLDHAVKTLEDGSKRFESTLQNVQDTISLSSDRLTIAVAEHNAGFAQRVNQLESLVADGSERIDEQLHKGVVELSLALDRGAHDVGAMLGDGTSRMGDVLAGSLGDAEAAFGRRVADLEALEARHRDKLQAVLDGAIGAIGSLMQEGGSLLDSASDRTGQHLSDVTARFAGSLDALKAGFAGDLDAFTAATRTALGDTGAESVALLDTQMATITAALQERVGAIYGSLDARTREFEANITQFGANIDTQTSRLHNVISRKSEAIEQGIEQGVGRFDEAMATHLQRTQLAVDHFVREDAETFKRQLEALTQALDGQSAQIERRVGSLYGALETHGKELESHVTSYGADIEIQASRMQKIIAQRSQLIEQNVEQGVGQIEEMLATHLTQTQTLVQQFVEEETENFDRQVDILARTLDGRSEILDSIIRTRGADFTDQLYASSKQFEEELNATSRMIESTVRSGGAELQERLAGQTAEMQKAFAAGLQQAEAGTSTQLAEIDARLNGAAQALAEALEKKSGGLVKVLDERTGALEQALAAGTTRIDAALADEGQRLSEVLAEGVAGLGATIETHAGDVGVQLRAQAAAVAAAMDEGADTVSQAVQAGSRELDKSVRDSVAVVRSTMEKSMDAAARLLATGVEGTQQQVNAGVEGLLARLAAHEKTAVTRMENAAANVGENTRKAAEMTAERLVTLNGALVQVLTSLGSTTRPATRKAKVEVIQDAAE